MKRILITGGSGLVGKAITAHLTNNGYEVAWLSRKAKKQKQRSFSWNVEEGKLDENALAWCDGIIHLAGAGVAEKRWTEERKKEILASRTKSSRLLRSEEHTSELQSRENLVCRLLLEKKK